MLLRRGTHRPVMTGYRATRSVIRRRCAESAIAQGLAALLFRSVKQSDELNSVKRFM